MLRNKITKKIILFLGLLFLSVNYAFAASINLIANKTNLTTDDIVEIHLSVEGQIDNGQVALKGLENFDVVGRSSSQNFTYINGKMTAHQETILDLKAKKGGKFEIQALAKENGKEIKSQKIIFNIQKSLIQKTREDLLKGVQNNNQNTITTNQIQKNQNLTNGIKNNKEDLKNLLTQSQNEIQNNQESENANNLLKKFPAVKHISPFNFEFYLKFFSLLTILLLFAFIIFQFKRGRKKVK